MLSALLLMAWPASRPASDKIGGPSATQQRSDQLAFSDRADPADTDAEVAPTTVTSNTVPSTTVTPTTVTPTTVTPTTVASIKGLRPGRVLLIGDSIAHETRVPLADWLPADIALDTVTFPGLAPCDLVEPAAETAVTRPPDVVILLFTGNAISPCMSDANDPSTEPYFQKYQTDMTAMVELFAGTADVWVVEPLPYAKGSTNQTVARLDEIFQSISGVDGVIPIRDLFTTPSGEFSPILDCLSGSDPEYPATEPCPSVRVRAADGVHLGDDDTGNQFGRHRMAYGFTRFLETNYE